MVWCYNMLTNYLLKVKGINKSFYDIKVLNDINFSLKSGSILGLVGQNGAGKSTLMKILAGVYLRDNGIIEIDNSEVVYNSPKEAIEYGIITIHQELSLTPNLSIAENIFLGDMSENKLGFVRLNSLYKKAESLLSEMGVNLNP